MLVRVDARSGVHMNSAFYQFFQQWVYRLLEMCFHQYTVTLSKDDKDGVILLH